MPLRKVDRNVVQTQLAPAEALVFWRRKPAPADALVAGLRQGDAAAVGMAYDLHHAAVRAFARRMVGDADVAEDLVQDVFVALPKAAHKFDERSALRTFLIGMAINHARHHVRAAMRRRAAWQRAANQPEIAPSQPDHAAADTELARLLTLALDHLSLDHRAAFVLCEIEERTSAEVAVIVGVPEATVRTRLFHAKRKLRELLTAQGVA